MRNDELKHYGVKGMKWRQHKYKSRDGSDGDYGYNYGNDNGNSSNNSGSKYPYFDKNFRLSPYNTARSLHNISDRISGTANKASKRDTYVDTYNPFHRQYKWDSAWQTGWKGGYQSNRKAQKAVKKAASNTPNYAGLRNYKVVNMYGDEPVKPRSRKFNQRVTQNRDGDRKLSPMEIAANKARNADDYTAKKNRQTRQKSKLSAEVRAKTLGEALGKVGRSASANSPMGRRKLRNQSGQAARDVMGRAVSKGKHTAKGAHELSSQYKRNKRGVETALGLGKALNLKKDVQSFLKKNGKKAMPKSLQKKSAANKRKKQIDDAKNWVSSKLNDANSLFNNFKTKRKVKGAAKKIAKNSKKVARSTSNLTKSSAAKDAKRWVDSKLRDAGRAYDNAKKEFNSYRAKKKTSKAAKKATSSLKKTSKGVSKTTKNGRVASTISTNGVKRYTQSELAGYKARSSAEAIRKATRNKSIPEGVKRMSNSEKSAYNVSRSAQQFTNDLSKSLKKKKKKR